MLFPAWETFYVIVGSAAGALTGLMFVVITLVSEFGGTAPQIEAFGTPTVVHFSAALLLSAILAAPWPVEAAAQIVLAVYGLVGLIYMLMVLRRARRQTEYKPYAEDWIFHFILPIVAYTAVLIAAAVLASRATTGLFAIAAAALGLLFIGIHNAWDTVTYVVVARWERQQRAREREEKSE